MAAKPLKTSMICLAGSHEHELYPPEIRQDQAPGQLYTIFCSSISAKPRADELQLQFTSIQKSKQRNSQ